MSNAKDFETGPKIKERLDNQNISMYKFEKESGYDKDTLKRWFEQKKPMEEWDANILEETVKRFENGETRVVRHG